MTRKKIEKIVIHFKEEKDDTKTISHEPITIDDILDEKGEYKFSAMFWDERAIAPLLAKYYPMRGVRLPAQMAEQYFRPGRLHMDIAHDSHQPNSPDKICEEMSIYPEDILHLWQEGFRDPDDTGKLIKPTVIMKASKSPVRAHGSFKSMSSGNSSADFVPDEDAEIFAR